MNPFLEHQPKKTSWRSLAILILIHKNPGFSASRFCLSYPLLLNSTLKQLKQFPLVLCDTLQRYFLGPSCPIKRKVYLPTIKSDLAKYRRGYGDLLYLPGSSGNCEPHYGYNSSPVKQNQKPQVEEHPLEWPPRSLSLNLIEWMAMSKTPSPPSHQPLDNSNQARSSTPKTNPYHFT